MSNHVTKVFHKIWGSFAIPHKPIRFRWIDFLLVLGIAGVHIMAVEWEEAAPEIVRQAHLYHRPII